jgi:hypothetical protein
MTLIQRRVTGQLAGLPAQLPPALFNQPSFATPAVVGPVVAGLTSSQQPPSSAPTVSLQAEPMAAQNWRLGPEDRQRADGFLQQLDVKKRGYLTGMTFYI